MASHESTPLLEFFTTHLSRTLVETEAQRVGVFKRKPRKLNVYLLVLTLILGIPDGPKRTLESLRVEYEKATRTTVARSSFYDRLNPALATLMKSLALTLLTTCQTAYGVPSGLLKGFRDLLALDATVLRLHALLAESFEATRTNHTKSAAKLHMVMSVLSQTPKKVKLSSERVGDTTPWKRMGKWVEGCLLLIDLGYYEFHLFDRIDRNKGFFLSRAKSNFNAKIVAVNRTWRGRSVPVVGRKLQEVLSVMKRGVLDVTVEVSFDKRSYRGQQTKKTRTYRLVALKNAETGKYHMYLTNLPPERLSAEDVTQMYALRWQVELFFKFMKSFGCLDDLPSSKKHIVELLIWSSIVFSIVSGRLLREVRLAVSRDRHLPLLRWGRVFASCARDLLRLLAQPATSTIQAAVQGLLDHLVHEAPDPNRNRRRRALAEVPYPLLT